VSTLSAVLGASVNLERALNGIRLAQTVPSTSILRSVRASTSPAPVDRRPVSRLLRAPDSDRRRLAGGALNLDPAASALFGLNVVVWLLSLPRMAWFPDRLRQDLARHARGPGFLTTVAGTAVLAATKIWAAGRLWLATH
jgi:hypothetical protein